MIGILLAIGYVLILAGAGAALLTWLRLGSVDSKSAGQSNELWISGWGWSYLIGTTVVGAVLYVPLALTGSIGHAFFAIVFSVLALLTAWHSWRSIRRGATWRAFLNNNWWSTLPDSARWIMLAVLVGATCSALSTRPTGFDPRAIYAMKARLLIDPGTVGGEDFQDVDRMHFNAHYPLLISLIEAQWFWLQGSTDDTLLRVIFLGYVIALADIVARKLRRYTTPTVAALATALLLCVPIMIQTNEGAGLTCSVDLPLACYATAGSLAAMHWLRKRTLRDAVVAGFMFGAAALTKSEGILWIAAAATSLMIVLAIRPSQLNRAVLRTGFAGAAVLCILIALQIAVSRRIPFSPYLRSYSAAMNWDWLTQLGARPWQVATSGVADCLRPTVWSMAWPCIAASFLLWRKRPVTSEIGFVRLLVAIVAAAFAAIFVITPYHVFWQIATALHRLVLQLLPLAWLLAVEQLSASGLIEDLDASWRASKTVSRADSLAHPTKDSAPIPLPTKHQPLRRAG